MRLLVVAAVLGAVALAAPAGAETYGNFETMGVVVDPPEGRATRQVGTIKAFLVEDGRRRIWGRSKGSNGLLPQMSADHGAGARNGNGPRVIPSI